MFGNKNQKEQEIVRKLILEEKIKLFPFKNVYRVYGDTFENRAALKKMRIAFKEEYDGVVITKEDLEKFLENDTPVRMKINQVIEQSKQNSKDIIAQSIVSGQLSLYLANDMYKVYGVKMSQKKDLYNAGFTFQETDSELHTKNFVMSKEDFEKTFSPQVVEYVDKFLQNTQGNLSGDYVNIVGSLMNNKKLKASDDWLYEPWLYNETTKNNVYKLKALAFVSDRSNVKRYGLEDESGNPLTIDSLKGKTADQMLDTIEKAQTKNIDDEDTTFYDVAQDNKSGAQNEFDYFRDVLKKANPTNVDKLLQVLDYISKDNTAKRDFLYSDSSNNTIQKDLVRYLQNYSSRNSRALTRNSNQGTGRNISGSYTVNDWLKEHNLAPIDIYSQFSKDLGTKVSRGKVSKYREYLTLILNNRTQLSNLLKYPVVDDTQESMLNSIVSYLNSFNEIVKKQNKIKKAEADLKNKPEVKQFMDDVVDALVTNLQLTRPDAITRFKQHYRPGMDEEQLLSEIVRAL